MLTIVFLLLVVAFIVFSITRWKLHPFLALSLAAILMGLLVIPDKNRAVLLLASGFGATLESIGIIIAVGTLLGAYIEKSGGARSIAEGLVNLFGKKLTPLAINLTGMIVSIPVYCDSGFIILSAINRSLTERLKLSPAVLAVALSTGLYTAHVFVPPTPGPLAAAANLNAGIGLVLVLGLAVSIPGALAGYFWAVLFCKNLKATPLETPAQARAETGATTEATTPPSRILTYLAILVPIALIALRSFVLYKFPSEGGNLRASIDFIGHPIIALLLGLAIAYWPVRSKKDELPEWTRTGLLQAGEIMLITAAGGGLGAVLKASGVGDVIGQGLSQYHPGIFLPFIIAAALKTAQGSSTVALLTTSALLEPLLGTLGLDSEVGRALAVLATGAGSMTVSHTNDSYFWVVARFSGLDLKTALLSHSAGTLVQGVVSIGVIWVLYLVMA